MATKITIVNEARYIDIVERALKDQNMDFTKAVKDNGLHVVFDVAGDFSFEGNFSPSWLLGFSKEVAPRPSVDSAKLKGKTVRVPLGKAKGNKTDDVGDDVRRASVSEAEMIADIGGHTVSGLIDE